jgi:hypothetical protein
MVMYLLHFSAVSFPVFFLGVIVSFPVVWQELKKITEK